jgi:glycosyltransferase involved in cell wall biosynthesis
MTRDSTNSTAADRESHFQPRSDGFDGSENLPPLGEGRQPFERHPSSVSALRVALFVNSIAMGGVEEHVRQIVTGLRVRGATALLVCPEVSDIDPLAEAVEHAGVRVVRLSLSRDLGLWSCLTRFWQFIWLLRSARLHVLHIHLTGYSGGRWAVLGAKLARVPATICTIHIAPKVRERWSIRFERQLMNQVVDCFIAVSQASKRQLIDYAGVSAQKTVAIPNAVELSRYQNIAAASRAETRRQFGIPEDARVLGTLARLDTQKGLTYLIAALPTVLTRFPSVHVLLVGDGPLRSSLHAQARELGVDRRVHFAGQQRDVRRFLAAFDIFVLPSLFEGLPLSILEAMAIGLPVIATRVDGTPEATEDGITGYLVPPADSTALASSLIQALANPAVVAAMASEARARSQLFSLDALLDRLWTAYSGVLRAS